MPPKAPRKDHRGGVRIPAWLIACKDLEPGEKYLFLLLTHLAGRERTVVGVTQQQLAALLGRDTATVKRAMRKFRSLGLIVSDRYEAGEADLHLLTPPGRRRRRRTPL